MAHISVLILTFSLLNAIKCGEASHKIQAAALSPWYCHRLIPAFITSAVTPCTYPCLFVSPYEHPHIVVHPEPDGTPCRITTGLDHHFKVGKCGSSVCQTTPQHATLKRKKRFICLYALVKLIQTKKKLQELKAAITRLEREGGRSSSAAVDTLGAQGNGRSGSNAGNRGDALSANSLSGPSGSIGIGGPTSSTERNPLIGNSGVGGGPGSGLVMNGNSDVIGEMGRLGIHGEDLRAIAAAVVGNNNAASLAPTDTPRYNGGTYGAPGDRFPTIGSPVIANSRGRGTAGLRIGGSSVSVSNIGSTGMDSRGGVNAGTATFPNSGSLAGGGSTGVEHLGGTSLGGSVFAGASSSSTGIAFPGDSNNENPTMRGTGTGNSGSGINAGGVPIINAHPGVTATPLGGGAMGSVTTIGTSGGTSDTGSASSPGVFPTGLGFSDNNVSETGVGMTSGTNSANSNVLGASIASAGTRSTVVASVSRSSCAGVSNSPEIGNGNSNIPSSRP